MMVEGSVGGGEGVGQAAGAGEGRGAVLLEGALVGVEADGEGSVGVEPLHDAAAAAAEVEDSGGGAQAASDEVAVDVAAGLPAGVRGGVALAEVLLLGQGEGHGGR